MAGTNFQIPISSAYKFGPYMHSVREYYEKAGTFYGVQADKRIKVVVNALKSKIGAMKEIENKFYELFGVKDAIEFSKTYLLNRNEKLGDDSALVQKLLFVLNTEDVYKRLGNFSPEEWKEYTKKLEDTAEKILVQNPEIAKLATQQGENYALEALFQAFNNTVKGENLVVQFNGTNYKGKVPQAKIKSIFSNDYIRDLLKKVNPDLKKVDVQRRIKRVLEVFDNYKDLFGEEYEYLKLVIKERLKKAGGLGVDKAENLSIFGNFASAEGGIFEIILGIGLNEKEKIKTEVLANDIVQTEKKKYSISGDRSDVYIVKNNKGENVLFGYKSPTDLIIKDLENGTEYGIQLKNTIKDINNTSTLHLQNTILLSTFLANVHDIINNNDLLNLLIYHAVNQSTFSGAQPGANFIYKILSACIEYYVESAYIRNLDNNLEKTVDRSNMGNVFMIYVGYLIPISSFVEYAIQQIEGDSSFLLDFSEKGLLQYKKQYTIEQIRGKSFEERINMGTNVYEGTSITEINIALGRILEYMNYFSPKS